MKSLIESIACTSAQGTKKNVFAEGSMDEQVALPSTSRSNKKPSPVRGTKRGWRNPDVNMSPKRPKLNTGK
ncbi:unnamed protein product [Gongylonema pulchrum]|uniref:Ovule protein n=1 Tax=Gongylonema pulchrum TaxID=637853 RepID=A0A183EJZ5_9BILA|nr:unnamed protein product [Gongylonema pulchrum]